MNTRTHNHENRCAMDGYVLRIDLWIGKDRQRKRSVKLMYRRETPTIFASLSFSKHANSMAQDPNLVSISTNPNQPFGVD